MFLLRNKKIIFELSSLPLLIWSSDLLLQELTATEKGSKNETGRVAVLENVSIIQAKTSLTSMR